MSREVLYRAWRPGDERAAVDLFKTCVPHPRTVGFWNWSNQSKPEGPSIVEVAECDGRLIGHYAVQRATLRAGERTLNAGLAIQAVVHPAYRDLRTILQVTERVWKRCADEKLEVVYGFPNDNMWRVTRTLMGWQPVTDFNAWEAALPDVLEAATGIRITRLTRFDDDFKEFLAALADANPSIIHSLRSRDFLQWRFFAHPLEHYMVWRADAGDRLVGYLAVKLYRKGPLVYGHFLDWQVLPRDGERALRGLIAEALGFFRWSGVQTLSWWCSSGDPCQSYFEQWLAPTTAGFTTHMGYKLIGDTTLVGIEDLARWQLTMADSDAF